MFQRQEYLTKQQVTSSCSKIAKLYREGKLINPAEKNTMEPNIMDIEEDIDDEEDDGYEEQPEHSDLFEDITEEIICDTINEFTKEDVAVGQYVLVYIPIENQSKRAKGEEHKPHFFGQTINCSSDEVEVNFLRKKSKYYWWPEKAEKSLVDIENVHVLLDIPDMDSMEHIHFSEEDNAIIQNCCC